MAEGGEDRNSGDTGVPSSLLPWESRSASLAVGENVNQRIINSSVNVVTGDQITVNQITNNYTINPRIELQRRLRLASQASNPVSTFNNPQPPPRLPSMNQPQQPMSLSQPMDQATHLTPHQQIYQSQMNLTPQMKTNPQMGQTTPQMGQTTPQMGQPTPQMGPSTSSQYQAYPQQLQPSQRPVWVGMLEWNEKRAVPTGEERTVHRLNCEMVSHHAHAFEDGISANFWPKSLNMQLIPRIILSDVRVKSFLKQIPIVNMKLSPRDQSLQLCKLMTSRWIGVINVPIQDGMQPPESRVILVVHKIGGQMVGLVSRDAQQLIGAIKQAIKMRDPNATTSDTRCVGRSGIIRINQSPEYIGRSSGSKLYFGIYDGKKVAVKKIQSRDIRELNHLRKLEHENIVRYLFMDKNKRGDAWYIVLQKCDCTLTEFMKDKPQAELHPLGILMSICKGMAYLHLDNKLVHRDLKPCNILMRNENGRWVPKISDFGISRTIDRNESKVPQTCATGTTGYMSPEALRSEDLHLDADIFSLGVVFYYVLTNGKQPFKCEKWLLDSHIAMEKKDIIGVNDVEENAKSIIRSMIAYNRQERPGIRQVMEHHLFWDCGRKMLFIQEVSDLEHSGKYDAIFYPIEAQREQIIGDWRTTLCSESTESKRKILESVFKKKKNIKDGVGGLLRTIRNVMQHYHEKSDEFKEIVGDKPDGVFDFFTSRFSKLLPFVYDELQSRSEELGLQAYYGLTPRDTNEATKGLPMNNKSI